METSTETTTSTDPRQAIADSIMCELLAQLDDLSDDTMDIVGDPEGPLFDFAEDLRLTLMATLTVRLSDFLCDAGVAEETAGDIERRLGGEG